MYERFAPRARKVLQLANQEAQRFNREFIGTEHVLLGILKESYGIAAKVLKRLGLDLRTFRCRVERLAGPCPDMVTLGRLPLTPRAKRVLQWAAGEADALGHERIDTAHLLLALVRDPECLAAQVLNDLGHAADTIRERTLRRLAAEAPPREGPTP